MKIVILTFLYMLLASTFGIGKLVLILGNPVFVIAVRMIVAGGLLLAISRIWQGGQKFSWSQGGLFVQLAFFHIYCAFIPEFWALQYVSGAKACLLYSLSPCITA